MGLLFLFRNELIQREKDANGVEFAKIYRIEKTYDMSDEAILKLVKKVYGSIMDKVISI